MGNSNKKSNYIVQGGILAAASILVRIIGMVYRIPVTRILGPIGNSYYSAAYEVYSYDAADLILQSSTGSLQAGISKTGSQDRQRVHIRFSDVRWCLHWCPAVLHLFWYISEPDFSVMYW